MFASHGQLGLLYCSGSGRGSCKFWYSDHGVLTDCVPEFSQENH